MCLSPEPTEPGVSSKHIVPTIEMCTLSYVASQFVPWPWGRGPSFLAALPLLWAHTLWSSWYFLALLFFLGRVLPLVESNTKLPFFSSLTHHSLNNPVGSSVQVDRLHNGGCTSNLSHDSIHICEGNSAPPSIPIPALLKPDLAEEAAELVSKSL